ncbi:MAG: helix-turn-helix transcriptional regulator [Clostridia bacterium]|nr:helix-turn-helix transcriptional regulator [Clostridia bacterium]
MKIYDYKGKKNVCGDRVHEARCRMRLTQSDLAARLQCEGVTMERDCVSRIEIGTRFVADYELMILAKILNVTVEWLLTEEDQISPEKRLTNYA